MATLNLITIVLGILPATVGFCIIDFFACINNKSKLRNSNYLTRLVKFTSYTLHVVNAFDQCLKIAPLFSAQVVSGIVNQCTFFSLCDKGIHFSPHAEQIQCILKNQTLECNSPIHHKREPLGHKVLIGEIPKSHQVFWLRSRVNRKGEQKVAQPTPPRM